MSDTKTGPVEVWLTQGNMAVTCLVVHEDETTTDWPLDTLSMRGAMRELTGYMLAKGYEPAGRWTTEREDVGHVAEASRRFKPTAEAMEL